MILVGFGSNLNSHKGSPENTIKCAMSELNNKGVNIIKVSNYYKTEPIPFSDQPNYINAVALVNTSFNPYELLGIFHNIENDYGRLRHEVNGSRTLDIDLLSYDEIVISEPNLIIPHPRLHQRSFVLKPLLDITMTWVHPVLNVNAHDILSNLQTHYKVELLD